MFIIDFLQVLKYCYFYNSGLIEKFHKGNLLSFMETTRNQYQNIVFYQELVTENTKNPLIFKILIAYGELTNLSLLFGLW